MQKRFVLLALTLPLLSLSAQTSMRTAPVRQVSLEDAIRLADKSSEAVDIARAATERANGQFLMARSGYMPQLNAQLAYARTLKSQFSALASAAPAPDPNAPVSLCTPRISSSATPAERQAALDASTSCQAAGGGIDFSKVGFGAKNAWTLGLSFSQPVFAGGKISAQYAAANAGRRAADIEFTAQKAQMILDVTQAYYNTVLAKRLAQIAEVSLQWSDEVLRQTTRARQVGSSAEFDLLRAQVARDNQVPIVLQRHSDQRIAELRLKQILEIPLDDSLELTTSIDDAPTPLIAGVAAVRPAAPDTAADSRATVREAAENVKAQEALVRSARGDRWPTVAITSGYQRLFYPSDFAPQFNDFRENWTIGFSAGVSLFSGGRVRGGELVAEANLREARARHQQAREFAALDSRIALSQLDQAEASWKASSGTAEVARRAYGIDQIRFREGISTQNDLTQSQLLVEQAMMNRAVAARDLAVARMRVALLKDLPLGAGGAGSAGGSAAGGAMTAPMPQQQPRTSGGASAASTTGSNQQ